MVDLVGVVTTLGAGFSVIDVMTESLSESEEQEVTLAMMGDFSMIEGGGVVAWEQCGCLKE